MPAPGRDFDSRLETTTVEQWTVSPSNSGLGKRTSVMPRLAMVVPTVMSDTWMPIIRPSVNSEFISGWPHSVSCLLYTSDAADEEDSVDLGGRRIIKKKK